MADIGTGYWDGIAREQRDGVVQVLWRSYCDLLHGELLARWLPSRPFRRTLKTDLFDEAVGNGLYPALASRTHQFMGMDVSHEIAAAAAGKYPPLRACRADAQRLPFGDHSFDLIVSNSTLDHFGSREGLVDAIAELSRILCPGGHLVLTMDNPGNPVVWLRNQLPFFWLKRMGIVPYYVGFTARRRELERTLESVGFAILASTAIMHCPRVLAVAVAAWISSARPRTRDRFLRHLRAWEALESCPTRYATGHFIALHAVRNGRSSAGER